MSRIAMALPTLHAGGAERVNVILAKEFVEQGYDVDFVLMQARGELLADVPRKCRVIDLKAKRIRGACTGLRRYLKAEKPQALLSGIWPLTSASALASRLALSSARLVVSDHNTLSRQYASKSRVHRALLRSSIATTYRLADARVAVSRGVADDLANLSGLPRNSFTVIHNPVSIPQETKTTEVEPPNWPAGAGKRILSVGTLKPQKNQALLLRAFAAMFRECDACLVILGEGELRPELEDLVQALGLTGRVVMPGFIVNPTPWYQSADMFVLASDYEGFGNVIVEALAAGVPVVCTDCPSGPAEILENGRYGRLVPVGDAHALAKAIGDALSDRPDREALVRRAADFTPKIASQQYLDLMFPRR